MENAVEEVVSEAAALADLVVWVAERPAWQSDALRRLVLKDDLSATDIDELVAICLEPKSPSEPITAGHCGGQGPSADPISLLRLEKPIGINALANDQTLTFAQKGLTIIYGDNGSGKSGYVRVLKHACRTRDRDTASLRDIADTSGVAQTADIAFARGDVEDTFKWTPTAHGHPELPSVSIFDSRSANVHVEKTNAVAYIPRAMKLLENLASACDLVKAKLESQLNTLAAQTPVALKAPTLKPDTAAGAFVRAIGAKTNISQLTLLTTMTADETGNGAQDEEERR